MQKKLIALAIATLASGAAFAQSNVTIYGSVDVGFSHRGDNINSHVGSQNAIDSGLSGDSAIGFKGVEDLGNGVSALFVLEAGFSADDGEHTEDGKLFGKQAFLGLTGGFGTAIAGRLVAPRYSLLAAIDPFGDGTVGRFHNVFSDVVAADVDRVDNAVAYVSPSFSGFNVTGAYSTSALWQEGAGVPVAANTALGTALGLPTGTVVRAGGVDNDGDLRVYTILPRYTNGPLDIGLAYQQIKGKDTAKDVKVKQWTLGGTYDFKVVKLSAYYDSYKDKDGFANLALNPYARTVFGDLKLKTFGLGVTVPFGKHAVLASYNQSKLKWDGDSGKAKQWALGYTYSLSKRTNFYAAYSDISNDDGSNDLNRFATTNDANNAGDGYQNGFQFGLKHNF
ncbi:MAG: porin [Zoogloeaceae bacterium]|jgi:predicted porin|nr:porin [Zoogloeaceae bacterium]